MNKLTMIPALIALGCAGIAIPAPTKGEEAGATEASLQEEHGVQGGRRASNDQDDIQKLYELVRQARADLEALRVQAGIPRREESGEHAEGGRKGRGEHAEGGREGRGEHAEGGREGRGEHAEGREGRGERGEGGEEGDKRLTRSDKWDETRNGARLILAYDPASQSFRVKGTVHNTTSRTLSQVRVEVHLSNGVELGPTKRTDLRPGARIPVELSAANERFTWWTTHPEHGSEEGHGPGHEGEAGEGGGNRPKDPALRPLYNQLQLLRQEIKMVSEGLERRKV